MATDGSLPWGQMGLSQPLSPCTRDRSHQPHSWVNCLTSHKAHRAHTQPQDLSLHTRTEVPAGLGSASYRLQWQWLQMKAFFAYLFGILGVPPAPSPCDTSTSMSTLHSTWSYPFLIHLLTSSLSPLLPHQNAPSRQHVSSSWLHCST